MLPEAARPLLPLAFVLSCSHEADGVRDSWAAVLGLLLPDAGPRSLAPAYPAVSAPRRVLLACLFKCLGRSSRWSARVCSVCAKSYSGIV